MEKKEVGKIFEEGRTYKEGCRFNFGNSGGDLYIFFNFIEDEEIEAIRKGSMKIGEVG